MVGRCCHGMILGPCDGFVQDNPFPQSGVILPEVPAHSREILLCSLKSGFGIWALGVDNIPGGFTEGPVRNMQRQEPTSGHD